MAAGVNRYSALYYAGVGGRVVINGAIAAFLKDWNLEVSCDIYGAPNFESPVAYGVAWDVKRFVGLAEAKVEVNGYATQIHTPGFNDYRDIILVGALASLVLYIHVDSGYSIAIPSAVVQSISYSQDATGTSPVEFKASFEVNGPINIPEDFN